MNGIQKKVSEICDQVILWSLTLLVFLVPLFFLPFTPRVMEFSKQLLLFAAILIGYVAWLAKGILDKKLTIKRTPLDIPIIAFLIVYLLATIFSQDKVNSLLGAYGQGSTGLVTIIFCALLYFLVVSNITTAKKIIQIGISLLSSTALLVIYVFLQVSNIFILPFAITKVNSFNPVGSLMGLTVFLVFSLCIATSFLLKRKLKLVFRILILVLILVTWILINTINFKVGWYLLTAAMFIILGFGIAKGKNYLVKKWLVVPGILLLIAIFGATLGIPTIVKGDLPSEVSLGNKLSWEISRQTVWSGFFNFLFGSGPETFNYDFSQYRPARFNNNILWNVRFEKANNAYLESLATTGILGILSLTVIVLVFIGSSSLILVKKERKRTPALSNKPLTPQSSDPNSKTSFLGRFKEQRTKKPNQNNLDLGSKSINIREIKENEEEEEEVIEHEPRVDFIIIGLIAGWASLFLAGFMTSTNTTLQVFFWLTMALTMALISIYRPNEFKKTILSFKASPKYALLLSFSFVVTLSVVAILFSYLGRIYLADAYHQKALEKASEQKYDEATTLFNRAMELNKYRPIYYLALAQNYLAQANIEAAKGNAADINLVQILVANGINQSKQATDLASEDVNFWEARGQIYENTTLYSQDANEWVIKSYQRAQELEPTNPVFAAKLGRAYMIKAGLLEEQEQEDNYVLAEESFRKAVELKPDYLAAHYYLALIYEKEEKLQEALDQIGICYQLASQNQEVIYEVGRLSYNKVMSEQQSNLEENPDFVRAINAFTVVISLNPNHANALYSLGLAYETVGELQLALDQMKKVQTLNPDNEQLNQKIESLESKLSPEPEPEPEPVSTPEAEEETETPEEEE